MKKALNLLSAVFTLSLLASCGPSACDCYECYAHSGFGCGVDIDDCIDKYGDDIPSSFRGTNDFSNAMKKNLRKECEDWKRFHNPSELRNMGYVFDGNTWVYGR
tara:strand:+ start:410 stop:721 length:312 start_codon:yes stop_codon:yes gene_type:complete